MAISDDADAFDTTGTDLTTGYSCPDCGADTVNGQGLYTCCACEWISAQ
jgi:ribosomal protein L37AE/L43A